MAPISSTALDNRAGTPDTVEAKVAGSVPARYCNPHVARKEGGKEGGKMCVFWGWKGWGACVTVSVFVVTQRGGEASKQVNKGLHAAVSQTPAQATTQHS